MIKNFILNHIKSLFLYQCITLIKHGCNVYFHSHITCLRARARPHTHTHTQSIHDSVRTLFTL